MDGTRHAQLLTIVWKIVIQVEYITYRQSLQFHRNKCISKTKTDSQTWGWGGEDSSQRWNMEARIIYFFCINIYAQVYWKYIISKGLLLGTRNSNQPCASIQMYTGSNKDSRTSTREPPRGWQTPSTQHSKSIITIHKIEIQVLKG